ncbi:MAG: AAA family ATPase [Synergistaceae bacterium]|jgi:hypothetical protein|nr:AAA family ATPase [Synergistaceae bacterium]
MDGGENSINSKLLKLPIGIQTFEKIRSDGCVYIDKTRYIIDMIDNGSRYFLSRPRKFGKSLTISTIEALFSGRKDLFKGLEAEEYFDRPDYRTYPIVRLDMNQAATDHGTGSLRSSLLQLVRESGRQNGVEIPGDMTPSDAFRTLILKVAEKSGPVVMLVDGFDKPALDFVHKAKPGKEARAILRNFYIQIKTNDSCLRFVFMAGISKLSKANIFADANSMKDISMSDKYARMLGFTEDELECGFAGYINATARVRGETKDELIAKLSDYYCGFSFDGVSRLYNPHDVLNFFDEGKFKNYWFDVDTPAAVADYIRKGENGLEAYRGLVVDEGFTVTSEMENSPPGSYLFQAGYLSVRERDGAILTLDFPNTEILSSVANLVIYVRFGDYRAAIKSSLLEKSLEHGRTEDIIKYFNLILSTIPEDLCLRAEARYASQPPMTNLASTFYHSVLLTYIWASRLSTLANGYNYAEVTGADVSKNGYRYIIELRVTDNDKAHAAAVIEMMSKLRANFSASGFEQGKTSLVAMAMDSATRQVKRFAIERL